jgi:hypothetical protein
MFGVCSDSAGDWAVSGLRKNIGRLGDTHFAMSTDNLPDTNEGYGTREYWCVDERRG